VEVFDGVAASWAGDTFITLWNAAGRLHRSRWLYDLAEKGLAERSGSISGMLVLLPTADPPDRATRVENAVRLRRLKPSMRRLVTVALGDSFRVSIARSVLRGMALVGAISRSMEIETTLERGARALLTTASPESPSLDDIREILVAQYEALGVAPDPWLEDVRRVSFTRMSARAVTSDSIQARRYARR